MLTGERVGFVDNYCGDDRIVDVLPFSALGLINEPVVTLYLSSYTSTHLHQSHVHGIEYPCHHTILMSTVHAIDIDDFDLRVDAIRKVPNVVNQEQAWSRGYASTAMTKGICIHLP